jgi:twitching motility protein PilT
MYSLEELLQALVDKKGSDLHITAGTPPRLRLDGALVPVEGDRMSPEETQNLVYGILNSDQIAKFEANLELDLSFGIAGLGRFRTNVFMQRGAVGAVLRIIPFEIKPMKDLGLPSKLCEKLCNLPKGLILVTGSTGSGKSTTLASFIDFINESDEGHIITIEDPIEFVHRNKKCLVNQREVGSDTRSFGNALRAVLREDPDVVLIGEMRDQETIQAALTLAETGHLTFGTLHTSDCVQTINRIVDVFPPYQQQQIRTQLSFTLQAVFSQQLLQKMNVKGRILACEVMVANSAVRSLIRDDKAHQIYSIIQTSGREGMRTMNQSLLQLYQANVISYEEALTHSTDPDDLKRTFQRGGASENAA